MFPWLITSKSLVSARLFNWVTFSCGYQFWLLFVKFTQIIDFITELANIFSDGIHIIGSPVPT